MVHYLSGKGHYITVVTTKRPNCPQVDKQGNVEIFRVGFKTLFDWFSDWLPGKKMSRDTASNNDSLKQPSLFHFLSETIVDLTWRKIYWPDGSCIWYFPARKMIRTLLKEKSFDTLVTVSMPFTTAWLGRYIKDRRPEIRWIHDIEDPFCLQLHTPKNNLRRYRKKNFMAEEEVLEKADRVVVTYSAMQKMYDQVFEMDDKIIVVPPLLAKNRLDKKMHGTKEKMIVFTYIGSFYSKIREPEILLSVFKQYFLQYPEMQGNSQVSILGNIPKTMAAQINEFSLLSSNLKLAGVIDHDQIWNFMKGSNFLINIGNTTGYQLPSKVVEYLGSGLPVINICQIPDDSFQIFAGNVDSVFNYRTYFQDQESELERLHKFITRPLKSGIAFDTKKVISESIVQLYFQGIDGS